MDLYIVRHAWAGRHGDPQWPNDFDRPLTPEGGERFTRVVEAMAARGFAPELVASSPMVRCRQTAEIIATHVSSQPDVVQRDELLPGGDLRSLLDWTIRQSQAFRRIAWVGHAPDVGRMTAALVGKGGAWVRFAKGALAAVRFPGQAEMGQGELRWLVTAKVLGL